jgi:hypothetical protein
MPPTPALWKVERDPSQAGVDTARDRDVSARAGLGEGQRKVCPAHGDACHIGIGSSSSLGCMRRAGRDHAVAWTATSARRTGIQIGCSRLVADQHVRCRTTSCPSVPTGKAWFQ